MVFRFLSMLSLQALAWEMWRTGARKKHYYLHQMQCTLLSSEILRWGAHFITFHHISMVKNRRSWTNHQASKVHGFSRSVATFLPVRATGAGWPISKAQLSRSRLIKFMSVYVYLCVFCLSNLLNLKVTYTITRRNKSLGLEVRLFITLFCVSVAFSLIINHPSAIRYYRCSAAHHAFCNSCHLPVWSLSPSCPFIVELAEPEASLQALICPWVAGEDSATMHAKHMEFFQLAIFRRATSRWWDGCWLQPQSWFPDMVVRWFFKKRDPPGDPPSPAAPVGLARWSRYC